MPSGIGEALREARLDQGRSLQELADIVSARTQQLEALEAERFDVFDGEIYARGFLRNYAVALGLDPAPLLATFRAVHARDGVEPVITRTPPVGAPSPVPRMAVLGVWVLVVALVGGGVVWLTQVAGGRSPAVVAPADDTTAAPVAPAPPVEPAPVTPAPPAAEVADPVRLVLTVEQDCWMSVMVDGIEVLSALVTAPGTLEYRAATEVVVRYGNAGGVTQSLNEEDLGTPGTTGQVVTVRYTPLGAERA
jgi:cytoskeletal protein RodZ